jgi:C1A family cysteine protease
MKKKTVTTTFLTLLLIATLTFIIQPTEANETIYSKTEKIVDPQPTNASTEVIVTGTTETQLAYDDGTIEFYTWWTGAGGIFAVRFTPPVSGQLTRCPFYIYSDPAAVNIHVMNSAKNDIIPPFIYDVTTTGWININLSAYEISVSEGVDFYIGLEWTTANAPTLGADLSSPDSRSWSWNGGEWSLRSDRDYMIRAIIESVGDPDIEVDPMHLDFYANAPTSTPATAQENFSTDYNRTDYPIMQPDNETLQEWIKLYNNAPQAYINPEFETSTGSYSLLDHLEYTPAERDQGACGNCWVWAGTGVLEVALDVQNGIKDRLSVQYFTSCWHGGTAGDWACCGGNLGWFAEWYQDNEFAIPWSNTNAYWQDGNRGCAYGTSVPSYTISTSPNYPISSCTAETIETQTVGQETAIANIKNILHQDKAIYFSFHLPNSDDWDVFSNFWNTEPESTAWSPDYSCGHTYVNLPNEGGGHAVLCVGYNDTDPNNSYWIMVNSWGTAYGGRPNGIFHVDMNMNYGCRLNGFGYSLQWQTLDVAFDVGDEPITISNVGDDDLEVTSIQCDQPWLSVSQSCPPSFVVPLEESHTVWIRADPTSLDAGIYYGNIQIYSNDPDENPVTVTVTLYIEESIHLVVRGFTNQIYYRSYEGSWGGWNVLPGSTCDAPAAAFLGNNLHVVVRSIDGVLLWHGYLTDSSDPNSFSGWSLISGASPSAPTLTSDGTALYLVVRGLDNKIYYRIYNGSWGGWNVLPGSTCDAPAAAFLGNTLHIVVRSIDGNLLWHGYLTDPSDPNSFSGWSLISGASPSAPTLTSNGTALFLVVRGFTNRIYYRLYDNSWGGWNVLPGSTCDGPAAVFLGSDLHVVVRSVDGVLLWHGYLTDSSDPNSFSGWSLISGASPSAPTLAS